MKLNFSECWIIQTSSNFMKYGSGMKSAFLWLNTARVGSSSNTSLTRRMWANQWQPRSCTNSSQHLSIFTNIRSHTEISNLKTSCSSSKMIRHAWSWLISAYRKIIQANQSCALQVDHLIILHLRCSNKTIHQKLISGPWEWSYISCFLAKSPSLVATNSRSSAMWSKANSISTTKPSRTCRQSAKTWYAIFLTKTSGNVSQLIKHSLIHGSESKLGQQLIRRQFPSLTSSTKTWRRPWE